MKAYGMALAALFMFAGQAFAFPPSTEDQTALAAVITDLLLWFSPIIAIALTMLAYRRVTRVIK